MLSSSDQLPHDSSDPDPAPDARSRLSRRTLVGAGALAALGVPLIVGGDWLSDLDGDGAPTRFGGATAWLNSRPLTAAEVQDRVVLVQFGTLSCINWLRTLPYIRAWSQAYRHDGLLVVGVHTPEFLFEHDLQRVEQALQERGIDFPVAVDNDYETWRAFDNKYWPALYLLDGDGTVRHQQFGEGGYLESERAIQQLLGVQRPIASVKGRGVEAEADWGNLRSPESYLGYYRSDRFHDASAAVFDEPRSYDLPAILPLNSWGLLGSWTITGEKIVLGGDVRGSIACRFHARDVHLVMSAGEHEPIPFRVLLNGAPPGPDHGGDVDAEGNGVLREGRLYQLVRAHRGGEEGLVEVHFEREGVEAYAFTFG